MITAEVFIESMLDEKWIGSSNGTDIRIVLYLNQIKEYGIKEYGAETRDVKMIFVKTK